MSSIVANRIITMGIILAVGCVIYRRGLVSREGAVSMSNILVYVVNPLTILFSFQTEFDVEMLRGFGITFAASLASMLVMTIVANLFLKNTKEHKSVETYALIFSNCGFFGIPVILSVYGMKGVFYLAAYICTFNILNWSYGIYIMKNEDCGHIDVVSMLKNLINPTIIASVLGFVFFVTGFTIPKMIYEPLEFVSEMNTPLSMLISGAALAQSSVSDIVRNKRLFVIAAMRLLVVPACIILPLRFMPLPEIVRVVVSVACACPCAASLVAFASKFDNDPPYCAQMVSVTTVFSAVTLPLFLLLYR